MFLLEIFRAKRVLEKGVPRDLCAAVSSGIRFQRCESSDIPQDGRREGIDVSWAANVLVERMLLPNEWLIFFAL
jgi:hypothetical protein